MANKGAIALGLMSVGILTVALVSKAQGDTPQNGDRFYMDPVISVEITGDGGIFGMYWNCHFAKVIRNRGSVRGIHNLAWSIFANGELITAGSKSIALGPGESFTWTLDQYADFRRLSTVIATIDGDWSGDNHAEGVAHL